MKHATVFVLSDLETSDDDIVKQVFPHAQKNAGDRWESPIDHAMATIAVMRDDKTPGSRYSKMILGVSNFAWKISSPYKTRITAATHALGLSFSDGDTTIDAAVRALAHSSVEVFLFDGSDIVRPPRVGDTVA